MANTKTGILDALTIQLGGMLTVATATRILLSPASARKKAPYIGLIAGPKEMIVEDTTDVRFELDVDLILLKKGRDIEIMLDSVKQLLHTDSLAVTIGALQISIIGQEEVALIDADSFSSTRVVATITYVSSKSAL
jgi:hypothetical protein